MIKTTLTIDGMMCNMCEAHVNDSIRKTIEAKKVKSSYRKGETVIITDEPINTDALKKAVDETGYTVKSIEETTYEKKGLFG